MNLISYVKHRLISGKESCPLKLFKTLIRTYSVTIFTVHADSQKIYGEKVGIQICNPCM